jgi:ABC-type multidrug transport system, ATPase and permease components
MSEERNHQPQNREARRSGPHFGPPRGGPHGMTMPVERAKDFKGTFKQLLRYLRPHMGALALVSLLACASTVFGIVSPRVMGHATTIIFEGFMERVQGVPGGGVDFAAIRRTVAILAALYVMSSAFGFSVQYIMAGVAQRISYDLRRQVNQKLSRLPLKFFDAHPHGEILSRVTNDVDNIAGTLQQTLTQAITSVVTFAGVLAMMLSMNLWLTLIVMLTLPASGLVTTVVAKRSQRYFKAHQRALGELNGHVEEMFTGHAVVKAFGREKESVERFVAINNELYQAGWRAQFISGLIMPMLGFISNFGYLMVSVAGGIMVARGVIPIGDVQAFIQYARHFNHPIAQLATVANVIQSTIASAERVFELLAEEEMTPDPPRSRSVPTKGRVVFEDVHFGYSPDEPLYEGLNLTVEPGQVVAIVGPTGAGKTTLVNLLMRFYEIDKGRILIDGVDIREMSRQELRSKFGMVLQDTWLFNGTIRDNIAYSRPGATEEEIVAAAKAAYADHFIRTLPDGYDTVLNEEASNLSQGQKQLLTIARAFLADPPMLILDEATSSVDTRTELQLQRAMEKLMKGRTSFVIAHRLSTIREADRILVMNEGRIVEQGRHDELLAAGGFYAELYNSQFLGSRVERVG